MEAIRKAIFGLFSIYVSFCISYARYNDFANEQGRRKDVLEFMQFYPRTWTKVLLCVVGLVFISLHTHACILLWSREPGILLIPSLKTSIMFHYLRHMHTVHLHLCFMLLLHSTPCQAKYEATMLVMLVK